MAKTALVTRAKVALPADIQKSLAAEVQGIQSRIGSPSGNRVKVTQKKTFRMPNGEENPGPIKAVILDFISAYYFYPGVYDPDDITPPDCFALGVEVATLAPHDTVPANTRQADSCAVCPQNQFGSAQRGKGKACQNARLLAILPPDADMETPIMTLKVSPTAIRPFDAYVSSVARSFQKPPIGVVTTIGFDPSSDYASLRFGEPEPISDDLLAICLARRAEAMQMLLTPPDTTSLKVNLAPAPKGGKKRATA
jgi:hypothetical protein